MKLNLNIMTVALISFAVSGCGGVYNASSDDKHSGGERRWNDEVYKENKNYKGQRPGTLGYEINNPSNPIPTNRFNK